MSGKLIAYEGIDGSGKSTQLELTRQKLEGNGLKVVTVRNLGGTPIGEQLREVIMSTTPRPPLTDVYISVAIQEALVERIRDLRQNHDVILLDRCPISLLAYQGYGSQADMDAVLHYSDIGMKRLNPDLVIVYDLNIEEALKRAREHSKFADYFESKDEAYFERVAQGYQEGIKRYGAKSIDGHGSIEEVGQRTRDLLKNQLGLTI